jgi:predicted transcriptional regulator
MTCEKLIDKIKKNECEIKNINKKMNEQNTLIIQLDEKINLLKKHFLNYKNYIDEVSNIFILAAPNCDALIADLASNTDPNIISDIAEINAYINSLIVMIDSFPNFNPPSSTISVEAAAIDIFAYIRKYLQLYKMELEL